MSIAQNPLVGQLRKSMGNFTAFSYGGKNFIRSKVFKKTGEQSEAQKKHIARFKLMADLYKSLGGMTNLGFQENAVLKSAYTLFMSANLATAVDDSGEVPVISYPKLLVAHGSIPAVKVLESTVGDEGITLTYETNFSLPRVSPMDEVIALAKKKDGELLVGRQGRGSETTATILIPETNLKADEVACCYIFVRSADGKKASNSVYVALNN